MKINKGAYNRLLQLVGLEPGTKMPLKYNFKLHTAFKPLYPKSDTEYEISDYDEEFVKELLAEKYFSSDHSIEGYPVLNSKYRPVFLYIRNHRQSVWDAYENNEPGARKIYYYHFMYCAAVRRLYDNGAAIVGSTRSDGYFYVYMTDTKQYAAKPLFTCRYCLDLWKKQHKGYRVPYSLIDKPEFLKAIYPALLHSDNAVFQDLKSILPPCDIKFKTYDPSWSRISHDIKELRNFACERCGRRFVDEEGNYTTGLEVHHKDRNKRNNIPSNLEVLCEDCHNKEHPRRREYFPVIK